MRVQYGRRPKMRWIEVVIGPLVLAVRIDGHIYDSKAIWAWGDFELGAHW